MFYVSFWVIFVFVMLFLGLTYRVSTCGCEFNDGGVSYFIPFNLSECRCQFPYFMVVYEPDPIFLFIRVNLCKRSSFDFIV